MAALEVWRLRQGLEREEWGGLWQDTGYLLTMEDGRPVDPSYLTRLFESLRNKTEEKLRARQAADAAAQGMSEDEVESYIAISGMGLARLPLHGLRHQAASMMWDASGDLFAVSKALRHSSPTATASVYTHRRTGKQRTVFGTIADALDGTSAHTLHTQAPTGA